MTENERLKAVRSHLGLTQAEFAKVLNIKQGSLSDIERSKSNVGVSSAIKYLLYKDYSISTEWLTSGKGEMLKGKEVNVPENLSFEQRTINLLLEQLDRLTMVIEGNAKTLNTTTEAIKLNAETIARLSETNAALTEIGANLSQRTHGDVASSRKATGT